MNTAIALGATGLTGGHLVQQLLQDSRFAKVKVFVRRTTGITHPKLEEHIVNFDAPDSWKHQVSGDVLYSCMGTTLKVAGSKEAQYKVDYTYQYSVAKTAADNGVPQYVLMSAGGANEKSPFFYNRMKGELERDIQLLPFTTIHILQPGILSGTRKESRIGEGIGVAIARVFGAIPGLGSLKPIEAALVAQAMINASFIEATGVHTYSMGEVFGLARKG